MKVSLRFSGLIFRGEHNSPFPRVARSVALFCPYCFRVWAVFTETDEHGRTETHHFAQSVPCAQHPAWYDWQIPGSLIERESRFGPCFDIDMVEALPLELLQREFDLHLKHWEKASCTSLSPASSASPPALPASVSATDASTG